MQTASGDMKLSPVTQMANIEISECCNKCNSYT